MDAKSEFALFQMFKTEIWDLILIHLLLPSILIFAKLSVYPSKGSVRSGSEWNGRKYKTDGKFTTHWWINVYELFPQQLLSTFSSFSKTLTIVGLLSLYYVWPLTSGHYPFKILILETLYTVLSSVGGKIL